MKVVISIKRKILFYMFKLSGGGAERTIVNIVNNLDPEKFEITLVIGSSTHNDYIELISKTVNIIKLDTQRQRNALLKLIRVIKNNSPELLFTTLNMNNLVLLLASKISFFKGPVIIRETNNRTASGKVTRFNKIITRYMYNSYSNEIVSLSEGVKKDLVENFKIIPSKIKVIYNPIDISYISNASEEPVYDYNFNTTARVIVSVGRLAEQKDYSTLLRAFKITSEKENVKLLILGKGPDEAELKKMCKVLDITNKVTFLGFKENPYKYMKNSDLFVLSSRWEGFGHVIVEAMATKIPVISSSCESGPQEIIGDNEYGRLFPVGEYNYLANEIMTVLKNERIKREYIVKGLNRANDFDVKKIISQYEDLILETMNNHDFKS